MPGPAASGVGPLPVESGPADCVLNLEPEAQSPSGQLAKGNWVAINTHIFALTTRAGHGSPNSRRRFSAPRPDQAHAAQLVENDGQNAPPAEKRDERLTAPLLRLLPGGAPGSCGPRSGP